MPCPPSQYVYRIFSSTSAAKAVEIGSALGMAEAMPFQNRSTADSSVARKNALGRNDNTKNLAAAAGAAATAAAVAAAVSGHDAAAEAAAWSVAQVDEA